MTEILIAIVIYLIGFITSYKVLITTFGLSFEVDWQDVMVASALSLLSWIVVLPVLIAYFIEVQEKNNKKPPKWLT